MEEKKNLKKLTIKESSFFLLFTLGVYFLLNLILNLIIQSNVPKGTDINKAFGKELWYACLSYGTFPLSFLIVLIIYGLNDKNIFPSVLKRESLHIKFVPYVLMMTFGIMFGFANANDYFIKFLQKTVSYEQPEVILPDFSVGNFIVLTIFIAVLPAVCEELLFREILFDSLAEHKAYVRVLLTAILFAFFHMSPAQTIYQFVFGCVFALTIIFTDSDLSSFLMHFLNNFLVLIFYYFVEFSHKAIVILMICGLIVAIIGITMAIIKVAKNIEDKKSFNKDLLYLLIPFGICMIMWLFAL